MKVDPNTKLFFRGKPMKEEEGEDFTLRWACYTSLVAAIPGETADGSEKMKRYRIAHKLEHAEKEVDLSTDEIVKIKELAGKVLSTILVGQVYLLLEGKKLNEKGEEVDA